MPHRLWSGRLQPERDKAEELGLRAAGCESDTNAARRLNETSGDFQQAQTDAGELALPQGMPRRYVIADIEQQPISSGVQNEPHL